MIRGERLGRPRRSARRGSIDWYMGTYDGYMEQCSIPSRFPLDSLGALELVCIGHRPCAPPPAAWPFARFFGGGSTDSQCTVVSRTRSHESRITILVRHLRGHIMRVTFTHESRSTICITSRTYSRVGESFPPYLFNPPFPRFSSVVPRIHRARGRRTRCQFARSSRRRALEVIRTGSRPRRGGTA